MRCTVINAGELTELPRINSTQTGARTELINIANQKRLSNCNQLLQTNISPTKGNCCAYFSFDQNYGARKSRPKNRKIPNNDPDYTFKKSNLKEGAI